MGNDVFRSFFSTSMEKALCHWNRKPTRETERRALTAALAEIGCGCFVPDLTRFTIPQCAGARQPELYSKAPFT